jgi:hypothetical protein
MPIIFKSSISECRIAVARVLPDVIDETADAAMHNIEQDTKHNHHGRMYASRREPGALHQASAPGESFATDTESLIAGMSKEKLTPLATAINFGDELGIHRWSTFEFGGGHIAPRPTIVPVISHMEDQFIHNVASAMLQALTEQELK